MKKSTIRAGIGAAVLLILYHLIVFLIPFYRGGAFWSSYVFTLLSFVLAGFAGYEGFVRKPNARSRFYGFPILKIAAVYLAAQFIAGLIFMAVGKWIPAWVTVLVYAIFMGAVVIGLISADAVVDEIHQQDQKLKKNITVMRNLQSKVLQMAAQCEDPAAKKAVQELSDAFRFSDPVSSDALADVEEDLTALVDDLQQAVVDADQESIVGLCKKSQRVLAERNRLCKINK